MMLRESTLDFVDGEQRTCRLSFVLPFKLSVYPEAQTTVLHPRGS